MKTEELKKALGEAWQVHHDAARRTCSTTIERLHRIAADLQAVQRRNFYQVQARVEHRGHYSHEHCTEIGVYRADDRELAEDAEEGITEALRDFMRWIYRQLEREYEYLTGDEAVSETIEANEMEFNEDGTRY